jgi:hypothetical protein
MSKDILLLSYCPHQILDQRVSLDPLNRKLLAIENNSIEDGSLKLYANKTWIPQQGLLMPAQHISAIKLPLNLKSAVSLIIKTRDLAETLTIPSGYYTPQKILPFLQKSKYIATEVSNSVLIFTDKSGQLGLNSYLQILGGESLGIPSEKVQGRVLYPPWQVKTSNSINLNLTGTPSQAVSHLKLPIKLLQSVNISISSDYTTEQISIPAGYYTSDSILRFLVVSTLVTPEIINDQIILTNNTGFLGRPAPVSIYGGDLLGLPSLELDPPTLSRTSIIFKKPILSNPIFKISYYTNQPNCYRCMGSGVENDYNFDTYGEIKLIENENLLYQACMKILLTDIGSNPFHTWYGSSIQSLIGAKMVTNVAGELRKLTLNALSKVQEVQKTQRMHQTVTPKELLYTVSSLDVLIDEDNPQLITLDIAVMNASSEAIKLNINYTSAQVAALFTGSNVSLGI